MLVVSLSLQHVKEVGAITTQKEINTECKILTYISLAVTIFSNQNYKGQVVIPNTQGTAKGFKNICGKYGIQVHFKGNTTIKQLLMKPKDQDPKEKKSGIIYSYQCTNIACNEE